LGNSLAQHLSCAVKHTGLSDGQHMSPPQSVSSAVQNWARALADTSTTQSGINARSATLSKRDMGFDSGLSSSSA
jgi:hypothetical protein